MSADIIALLAGTVLGVGALAFVLYPLFFTEPSRSSVPDITEGSLEESAIVSLREIEFDRATGKLSEADYAELRAVYEGRALQELRAAKPPLATSVEATDPIEARVRAYRLARRDCPTCGLRPEPDAIYCSTCGGFLDRVCPACSAPITESGATFCSSCGVPLARRTVAIA
jgi:hypothetical protein